MKKTAPPLVGWVSLLMQKASLYRAYLHLKVRALARHMTKRRILIVSGTALGSLSLLYTIGFFWPRTITFTYAKSSACITSPTLLPQLMDNQAGTSFEVTHTPTVRIGSYPLYSSRTCVTPTAAPRPGAQETIALQVSNLSFIRKHLTVIPAELPRLSKKPAAATPLATTGSLHFSLSSPDTIFNYHLMTNDKTAACSQLHSMITCDMTPLQLTQSAAYTFSLERRFNDQKVSTLFTQELQTVEAVAVRGSSILPEQQVFDAPASLTLTLNKPAASIGTARLERVDVTGRHPAEATFSADKTAVTITWKEPLARSATYTVIIEALAASDGGFLQAPYGLTFYTSGGPKVLGVNIGSSKVSPSASMTLGLDSLPAAGQALDRFVKLELHGTSVPARVTQQGKNLTITPLSALPRCAAFTVRLVDGLQNTYGVSGGSAWSYTSRTLCQTVFSIGTSAKGRSITAYRFGSGASKIVYLGGTHGNEKSSVSIMNRWIDYLESNAPKLPAHRSIIVIPVLNPDGYAASTRMNANSVDLNRNFPSFNWKAGVTMPDNSYHPTGGGATALSEPESQALAAYILGLAPRLVLTYHASGGVVVPNGSGDSRPLAITYGKQSSVGFMENSASGSFFAYDTTGAFEDWLHDKHGIPTLLIELLTKTNQEFSGHQTALWHTALLP